MLRTSAALTGPQTELLRSWHRDMLSHPRPTVEGAAAYLFFHFFPMESVGVPAGEASDVRDKNSDVAGSSGPPASMPAESPRDGRRARGASQPTLESALRKGPDGELTLGGSGAPLAKVSETWRDRTGPCSPNFSMYARDDDGAWLAALAFLQAMLAETVTGMFHGHDERAVRLAAKTLRLKGPRAWRLVTHVLDGIGFVASFVGRMAAVIDGDKRFRVALGQLPLAAVDVETSIDAAFDEAAASNDSLMRGRANAAYCKQ